MNFKSALRNLSFQTVIFLLLASSLESKESSSSLLRPLYRLKRNSNGREPIFSETNNKDAKESEEIGEESKDSHSVTASLPIISSSASLPIVTHLPQVKFISTPISLSSPSGNSKLVEVPLLKQRQTDSTAKIGLLANVEPTYSTVSGPLVQIRQIDSHVPVRRKPNKYLDLTEPAKHWSALENYYNNMRPIMYLASKGNEDYKASAGYYHLMQQELLDKDPLPNINLFNQHQRNKSPENYVSVNQQSPFSFADAISQRQVDAGDNIQQSVFRQTAPGLSRSSEIFFKDVDQKLGAKIMNSQQVKNSDLFQQSRQPLLLVPLNSMNTNKKSDLVDWQHMPELILAEQQQQRAKQQEAILGSIFNREQAKSLLLDEAYCGPRNYIKYKIYHETVDNSLNNDETNLTTISEKLSSTNLDEKRQFILDKLVANQKQRQHNPSPELKSSIGEYPSHLGIYIESVSDENFLCGATWIRDKFALTLASCFTKKSANKPLVVRIGEWNADKQLLNNDNSFKIVVDVKRVYAFPKYSSGSSEHDLALIEFVAPVNYMTVPYVIPACQLRGQRSHMQSVSTCWTPVRNITSFDEFDAHQGKVIEKQSVNMSELPVRLIFNDDDTCMVKTQAQNYHYKNPNYICSGHSKLSPWRASLNETSYFGSGIYCEENGNLVLVSILSPVGTEKSNPSTVGFLDLKFYEPWIRNVISQSEH